MSHADQDITIPALTVEQIASLEENQLSLDLSWPAGSADFHLSGNMNSVGAAGWTHVDLSGLDLNNNIDWNVLASNSTLGPVWSDTLSVNPGTTQPSAKISLQGEDADIEINGESVVGMLREIRDRLNIIQVSETMEREWDELRALREQYEAKLAECREKSQAWDALKQMPPPQVP